MKIFCVSFIILSMNFNAAVSVNLQCSYEYSTWKVVGGIYYCRVKNDLNIISLESAVINGATGSHDGSKNNDDVHGFYADNKKMEIFPLGLEKIYKNLKLISIWFGRIREIHQKDLKPFSHLEYLSLDGNDIEVLEEGLFDFNPKLGFISFSYNKISQIYPNVFDHLTKLTDFYLNGNQCISKYVENNSAGVKEIIKQVKLQCPSPSIAYKEVPKLKLNFNDQNLQFTEKPTKVEKAFQNSNEDLKSTEAETTKRFESLEKTLKSTDENFNNFQSKVMASFTQILDKIDNKMKKLEDLKSSQIEAFKLVMEKVKILDEHINQFQDAVEHNSKTVYLKCDP